VNSIIRKMASACVSWAHLMVNGATAIYMMSLFACVPRLAMSLQCNL
jgi:hypothetical protein